MATRVTRPDGGGVATREANLGEEVASRETVEEVPCSCRGDGVEGVIWHCGTDGSRRTGVVAAVESVLVEVEVILKVLEREDSSDGVFLTNGEGVAVGSGRLRGLESHREDGCSCSWLLLRDGGGVGKSWPARTVGFVRPGGFPLSAKSSATLT